MRTLNAHLSESGSHVRLPFHPECPVCREERLAGSIPRDEFLGLRAGAVLAAGALAFSSLAPTAAFAAEGDSEQEGTAPVSGSTLAPVTTNAAPDPDLDAADSDAAAPGAVGAP